MDAPELLTLWREWGLQMGAGGVPMPNMNNVITILQKDPALESCAWFDTFLQRVMTGHPAREWAEFDDLETLLYIQRDLGICRMGREAVSQAVLTVAHQLARNCVQDWLESLKWDGIPRVNAFFGDCFGADENEYTASASRNFWLSMVARIYRPGSKVDNMVVLEGPQGAGKSSALQVIGGAWFAEQHESAVYPKAFAEVLQGKWLIEISEMDSFNRSEVNRVKQTISCSSDRFRPSYAHHAADHLRQCIFVGTTNHTDWNRDETGARRFWPISCKGLVRLDVVRENRAQLFAEAVVRHRMGEAHWLMPMDATKAEQEARYEGDAWLDTIEYACKGETRITTAMIADKIGIPLDRRSRVDEMRIGKCLRFLGWERTRLRINGERSHVYVRPEA